MPVIVLRQLRLQGDVCAHGLQPREPLSRGQPGGLAGLIEADARDVLEK